VSSFPPGVTGWETESRWRDFIEAKDAILSTLSMPLRISHLRRRGREIGLAFRRDRPMRPRQMERLGQIGEHS
jgi:hypothetical protein